MDLNSKISATNTTFHNHSKALYGTVIYGSQNSNIDLTESTLCFNQAKFGVVIFIANCTLNIVNTILESNNATDGGVIYAMFSNANIHNSSCIKKFAKGNGGCLYATSSNLSITNSDISSNQAFSGGGVMMHPNSDFIACKTKFYNNKAATGGGAIYHLQSGHMALDHCTFRNNSINYSYGTHGSDIEVIEVHNLRISKCEFVHESTDPTAAISVTTWGDIWTTLFSFETNINYGLKTLSTTDQCFLNQAIKWSWIYRNSGLKQHETKFASCKYLDNL